MKIGYILGGVGEGGLENHFFQLVNSIQNYLPSEGTHQIIVFAHEQYRKLVRSDIIFETVDLTKSRRNPLILYNLIKLINKHNLDIIHAHANKATSLLNNVRLFVRAKQIGTLHSQKKNTSMYNHLDHVIGVSKSVLSRVENENKTTVYNGLPDEFLEGKVNIIKRSDVGIENNNPVIIGIGRLVKVKAFDVLISAVKEIKCNLLIIGEGPERYTLEQQIAKNNYKHVKLLGFKSNIRDYIAFSDLTVISSLREGFSYVVAESLVMNTAVVSTDVPVGNEILPKACIVKIGDPEALAGVIEKTLANQQDFTQQFEFARQNFTLKEMNKKIVEIYQNVMNRH